MELLADLAVNKAEIIAALTKPASDPEPPPLDIPERDMVAGLMKAARRRPPSWAEPAAMPQTGCFCVCCDGRTWWREAEKPKGWRCRICHPPPCPAAVVDVLT